MTPSTVRAAAPPEIDGTSSQETKESWLFQARQPPRFTLSIGRDIGDGWIAVEGDLEPGLTNEELEIRRDANWNVRIGGRLPVSDSVSVGAGAFTDRSPQPTPSSLGEMRIDYVGLSTGAQLRSAHGLSEGEGEVVFSTTIAIRYARGTGNVGGSSGAGTATTRVGAGILAGAGAHPLERIRTMAATAKRDAIGSSADPLEGAYRALRAGLNRAPTKELSCPNQSKGVVDMEGRDNAARGELIQRQREGPSTSPPIPSRSRRARSSQPAHSRSCRCAPSARSSS